MVKKAARTMASEHSIEIERRVKSRLKSWIEKCMVFLVWRCATTSESKLIY